MSIQPDSWIKKMCKEHNMIEPFLDHQVSEGKISYGLSSMGYDVRISDEYRIFCNVTPIENEFEGNIVIELSNTTPNPAKIYSNEGIAQFLFFKSETQPETTYKSKNGKYQGQTTIQVAKIK